MDPLTLGIVGAGQLARMVLEEASALGISCVVLADSEHDSAALTAGQVIVGAATDADALRSLQARTAVITFDHELVDLSVLRHLEQTGAVVRPSSAALQWAVDKATMRAGLSAAGLPVPAFRVAAPGDDIDLAHVGDELGWPLVIKAARGGYDGRGVFVADDLGQATVIVDQLHHQGTTAVIEEHVRIERELSALIARGPDGEIVSWPVVETAQIDGVCREVLLPGEFSDEVGRNAAALGRQIAELVGVVGVMAVELFLTNGQLVVNELAMRPHNSGHWTQDGSITSQFENHARAVLGLPLGATEQTQPAIACVNVFGSDEPIDDAAALRDALREPTAHVHLYGKQRRPGRKLGHVNVVGQTRHEVRRRAWETAAALGTPIPEEMREVVR